MIATRQVRQIAPNQGTLLATTAGDYSVKIEAEETEGAYAVMVATITAGGGPPPLHAHPFGESFYVLGGTFEFSTLGEHGLETLRPAAGGVVNVPAGAPHTF